MGHEIEFNPLRPDCCKLTAERKTVLRNGRKTVQIGLHAGGMDAYAELTAEDLRLFIEWAEHAANQLEAA